MNWLHKQMFDILNALLFDHHVLAYEEHRKVNRRRIESMRAAGVRGR